ncbi:hypothetical protein Taro_030741, partial [Colocasia esculenta]|nr:hypothetical protein [Colocasia esculenta]
SRRPRRSNRRRQLRSKPADRSLEDQTIGGGDRKRAYRFAIVGREREDLQISLELAGGGGGRREGDRIPHRRRRRPTRRGRDPLPEEEAADAGAIGEREEAASGEVAQGGGGDHRRSRELQWRSPRRGGDRSGKRFGAAGVTCCSSCRQSMCICRQPPVKFQQVRLRRIPTLKRT